MMRAHLKTVSSVMLMRIIGIGFQLSWFMLLVRLLPMQEVGIYAAINAAWLLMRALGPAGSDQALMKTLPELFEMGDYASARAFQRSALRHALLHQLGMMALVLVVGYWFLPLEWLLVAVVTSLFYGVNGQQVYVMLAAGRPLLANSFETIWLPVALALAALALYARDTLTLTHLLFAQGIIMAGFCTAGLLFVSKLLRTIPNDQQRQKKPASRRSLGVTERESFRKQSYALFATSAVIHLNMRLPVVVAPYFIGAAQTALLETAMRFATLLGLVAFAAAQVFLPKISALANQGKQDELQQLLHQSSWLIFIPTLVLVALLALLGDWMIGLFAGEEYRAAYAAMMSLAAAYVVNAAAGPMQHVFTMSGKASLVTQISVAEMTLSAILIILCAMHYGALGMAGAVAAGMLLRNGLFHWQLPRQLQLQPGVMSRAGIAWLGAKR